MPPEIQVYIGVYRSYEDGSLGTSPTEDVLIGFPAIADYASLSLIHGHAPVLAARINREFGFLQVADGHLVPTQKNLPTGSVIIPSRGDARLEKLIEEAMEAADSHVSTEAYIVPGSHDANGTFLIQYRQRINELLRAGMVLSKVDWYTYGPVSIVLPRNNI